MRWGAYVFAIIGICWLGGLIWFAQKVPSKQVVAKIKTDAIVVLTGGTGRLDMGLVLLETGFAKKLFVSGVALGVDVNTLLRVARRAPKELECCISVGYRADDTAGNATETANWVKERSLQSIRLVTANYHMPRSLAEFNSAMPHIKMLPHPVYPTQFKRRRWWLWPGSALLLASEFNKYLVAAVGRRFRRAIGLYPNP